MPDNTNVNNNASVVVVGRTAPVPPGQQKSDKSVPVVIASDQSTIPVAEQNKVASEVALSLLGIPRSEVALGIFADVNTYDVNPTEWAAEPEVFTEVPATGYYGSTTYTIGSNMGHGLTHIPEESGALLEAPVDKFAILTSKRFFRYQPGRVSAATFGVKTTVMNTSTTDTSAVDNKEHIGSSIFNPAIRKYGIFDNFDGYYWETRNNGQGDNFCVVRRTQSLLFNNPIEFSTSGQTSDFGATNPLDVLAPRGNESPDDKEGKAAGFGGTSYPAGHDSTPVGFENVGLGSMVIYRDNLMMTHASMYDPSLLQDEITVGITSSKDGALTFASNTGMGVSISNAVYDINSGIMTVTCHDPHNYPVGKYVHLSGIGMTCEFSFIDASGNKQSTIQGNGLKKYPDRTFGYNILQVGTTTSFSINVGVSTVPTFYHSGGVVLGLSTSQYVSYSKGTNGTALSGLVDGRIYKVNSIEYTYSTGITTVGLKQISDPITSNYRPADTDHSKGILVTDSTEAGHSLTTPVPFVRPVASNVIPNTNIYSNTKRSGMFPYMYKDKDGNNPEGYIDTTLATTATATLESQISLVNDFYKHWINQNVKKDFWNVYEYRVPRSRFSGDRLDNATDKLLYSDVTANNRAGSNVIDPTTGTVATDTSIWNLEFDKVTMYKIEFSWYGAVGALFLAYVPVGAGEARWVRVHHLRASNQLKGSSLGNATLPITYMVYGGGSGNGNASGQEANNTKFGYSADVVNQTSGSGFGYGSPSEHIVKYGASYYIDGGDRGTVKLFSHGTQTGVQVFGSKKIVSVGSTVGDVNFNNSSPTDGSAPFITPGGSSGISANSSFFVGSKVITGNDLDQNIEITYADGTNLFLNSPLAAIPSGNVTIIFNRTTPLIGLKCRDFITSSLGQQVRNRTQVYPTRLSTGSTALIKVDLLKSPIFQTSATVTGSLSLNESVEKDIGKRGKSFLITVSNNSYIDQEDTGVYGYFRGRFKNDPANKVITVFGFLERRSATTGTPGYYFRAENSTTDDILLEKTTTFLYEAQTTPRATTSNPTDSDFTLDSLSSIKVSPQVRAPIPKTGTIVASLFIPASGAEFDLSSYFDFNKEYLSFPLTNVEESLFVVGSSEGLFDSSVGIATVNASITWEEQ